jgi:hypothetical protein
VIALEPLLEGVDDALGGVDHALAAGIVPGPGDEGANSGHGVLAGGARHGFKIKVVTDQGSVADCVHG